MNLNINFYIFVVIIFITRNYVQGRLTDVIQTDKGKVRGEIIGTIQNESIKYSSFRGIPYAKPPIGKLRFQPPVEADTWSHVINATSNAPSCPQINEDLQDYDGDEDCLYLNVYSPKTSFNESDNELLAVMVWIYGGGLTAGVIRPTTFGPDFLVADNVLVVAMNYRVGALGFLSLDIPEATGNMAFKDQILALKWIQKNIKNFGGDPNKVTIFGLSSGSQCVTLQHLSPASKGLFRSIIAMSGSTLGPTGFLSTKLAVKQAFQFSSYLGLVGLNKTELFNKLRHIPAKELVQAEVKRKMDGKALAFSPTIENPMIAKDIFLSTCPLKIYQKGNYPMMPAITGYTSTETLIFTSNQASISGSAKSGKEYLTKLGFGNSTLIDGLNALIDKDINNLSDDAFYLGINITSDITFNVGVDSTQRYLARGSFPVFYYRNSFDYEESRHRIAGINRDGCAHADDVSHIFWQPVKKQPQDPTTRIGVHRTRMARLWTNFVKYLNPTPNDTSDPLVNFTWFPSGPEGFRLEIGNEKMEMKPRLISDTINAIQVSTNPYEHADCID
ncbi:juvenile hormone esterase-like [Aphidius gifuensis]|uniref:juvenile hormone esterase-like n=1 Tax=Aphidius gifuensis TaxID=684658 RepID=UPI001CDC3D87|nr:juvenile hormone esterase-like [Aphidius gifuensis]